MANDGISRRIPAESPDVATISVLVSVAGFIVFSMLIGVGLFFYLKAGAPDALRKAVERRFPEPTLQKTPQADLKNYQNQQRNALATFSWVDRSQGLARIPITEAMRIIAARGDHAFDPIDQSAGVQTSDKPQGP